MNAQKFSTNKYVAHTNTVPGTGKRGKSGTSRTGPRGISNGDSHSMVTVTDTIGKPCRIERRILQTLQMQPA
jgi:hypothetical protein